MITRNVKILPLMLFLLPLYVNSASAKTVTLDKVTLIDEGSRMQIFIRLSALPEYHLEITGKRIDLLLQDTIASPDFTPLSEGDKMIRMVSRQHNGRLRLSFYFRYPPQEVDVRKTGESSSLMMDILLGNPFSARYPDLSSRLQGVTMLNRKQIDYTNPLYATPYGTDWKLFFRDYESPVLIQPQPIYTLPPFPLADTLSPRIPLNSWLPEEIIDMAAAGRWSLAEKALKERMTTEENESFRDRLLLSYAEALVRDGRYEEPYTLLQQISHKYPDSRIADYAGLLFLYLAAEKGDPYLAFIELEKTIKKLGEQSPLSAWLNILQAELSLETDRVETAIDILKRDTVAYLGSARFLRLLRQADSYYDAGDKAKALVAYANIEEESKIINQRPSSLARYADSLYLHRKYQEAAEKYNILNGLIDDGDKNHLAMFRLAMSRLHTGDKWSRILPLLGQVQTAYPGTEGAYRARIKQTDLFYLNGREKGTDAAMEYGEIGRVANRIILREEALLKQAMINALEGNHETSIEQAMKILREFHHGSLMLETKALVLSQLTGVLKKMISEKRYIAALVLAKKNREFFARGWLDGGLLHDLAEAYVRLGVYDRAVRAYKYLLEVSSGEDQEKVYLPLLKALYESGRYSQVEDYADRYLFRYKNSPRAADIFLLRIQALLQSNKLDLATTLLDDPDRPTSPRIERAAAKVYFEQNQWDKVIERLKSITPEKDEGPEWNYLLAESCFQSGRNAEAESLFTRLQQQPPYVEQAMFRLAELKLREGKPGEALKQFRKLTEKGTDPRWVKMAEEEIKILRLEEKISEP